jgi:hypothetical protein
MVDRAKLNLFDNDSRECFNFVDDQIDRREVLILSVYKFLRQGTNCPNRMRKVLIGE